MGSPTEHAKCSPSAAERWMTCPGSVVLSDGMPESSSEYADEGTRAHAMAERWLLTYFAQHQQHPTFKTPEEAEMAKNVKLYVDECIRLSGKGVKVFTETRVAINQDVYGTADFIAWHAHLSTLHIRDLKYGAGVAVDVGRNRQLRIYALAALITMKLPATTVSVGIVQPRYDHPDGAIRTIDFDVSDLVDLHADVTDATNQVAEARQTVGSKGWEQRFLVPSEKGCRWCPASAKCPMLKQKAQTLARQVFAPNTPYDPLALAQTLDFLPILEGWIKNTREFAYGEAEKGQTIPDYKLVEKTAVRKWKEDVVPARVAKTLGVEVTELFKPAELINIGDAVKLAPGKNAKERDEVLEPFVERKSSGHTLVHISDKRDPVRIDAKAAFSIVDAETPAIAAGVSLLD